MDYGLEVKGRVYTPNQTTVSTAANATRNADIERAELARWAGQPESQIGYYDLEKGTITTWQGAMLGHILPTSRRVYPHNFGGRFVSLRMRGTNGAEYYGRASYDRGTVIRLRRAKR